VTSRGDRRESIFAGDEDRATLLAIVEQGLDRFDAAPTQCRFTFSGPIEVFKNHDKHKSVRTEPVEVPHRGMRWLGQAQPERCGVS
jgi:hypothetical protein